MSILPKAIYRLNTIPVKIPMVYFTKLEQIIQKYICNYKKLKYSEQFWERRTKLEELCCWYQTTSHGWSNQSSMVMAGWQTHTWMEQNGEPRNKPTSTRSLIFDKGVKNTQWVKGHLFNTWCWKTWIQEKNERRPPNYTVHNNKLKMD